MNAHIGPASSPMGFISDIHGNLEALEAVLTEFAQRAVVDIYVAGDLLLGGDEPLAVWQCLTRAGARCVQGVSDAALASVRALDLQPKTEEERARADRFRRTQQAVGDLVLRQLSSLPRELRIPMIDGSELLLVHGSPGAPTEEISHELDDEEMRSRLADDPADIIVCGATHVPFIRDLGDVQVVNVGSVGQAPEGRFAHYTIISPRLNGADATQVHVEY
ncbi:MAG: metallophosphoesterase family protein [Myxococcales bacterium]|nr:metallophosphoesterase family protein [Myxococcales bacterium]